MNWAEQLPTAPAGYQLRVFQADVDDGHLTVFVGREPLGRDGKLAWHLSISHRSNHLVGIGGKPLPGRIPTWEEMKDARYRFCPDDCYMAIILPPPGEYVNVHPTTMHLHELEDQHG